MSRWAALAAALAFVSNACAADVAWGIPRDAARVFVSGHSLTDNPLADDLVQVALDRLGANAAKYNQQIYLGSPIRGRVQSPSWLGYRTGKNRQGHDMNVVAELRNPATLGGDRYDTLIITENHNLLEMLEWENTVRNLRHFHETFISGNRSGRTFFYESWKDVSPKSDPRAWIAHERAASPAWQCVAARVNHSLAAEGRNDRIQPLPAGAALAELVERATQGHLPGITGSSVSETMNRLFSDDVHLTRLGSYYVSLVAYAAVYERSPVGAAAPSGVTSEQARSLQELAWSHASRFYATYRQPELSRCRTTVVPAYCGTYWRYNARNQPDAVQRCVTFFSRQTTDNPLFYDAQSDASYWYAAAR